MTKDLEFEIGVLEGLEEVELRSLMILSTVSSFPSILNSLANGESLEKQDGSAKVEVEDDFFDEKPDDPSPLLLNLEVDLFVGVIGTS